MNRAYWDELEFAKKESHEKHENRFDAMLVWAGEFTSTSLVGRYRSHPFVYIVGCADDVETAFKKANDLLQNIFKYSKLYGDRCSEHNPKEICFYIFRKLDHETEDKAFALINERLPLSQRRVIDYTK